MTIKRVSKTRQLFIDKDRETRYNVLERDDHKCFICNRGSVEVHEIIPRSRFGLKGIDVLFSMKNRVSLCREHHEQAHTRLYRVMLIAKMIERFGYNYIEDAFVNYTESD